MLSEKNKTKEELAIEIQEDVNKFLSSGGKISNIEFGVGTRKEPKVSRWCIDNDLMFNKDTRYKYE